MISNRYSYVFGAIKKITDGCFIFLDAACTISSRV